MPSLRLKPSRSATRMNCSSGNMNEATCSQSSRKIVLCRTVSAWTETVLDAAPRYLLWNFVVLVGKLQLSISLPKMVPCWL